jgi:cobaltochelatase CobT
MKSLKNQLKSGSKTRFHNNSSNKETNLKLISNLLANHQTSKIPATKNPEIELIEDFLLENNFFAWNQNLARSNGKKTQIYLASKPNYGLFQSHLPQNPPVSSLQKKEFSKNEDLADEEILLSSHRANLDLAYCYLGFHDFELHQKWQFLNPQQKIFDEFEKIRVLALASHEYIGIASNVLSKIEDDISCIYQSSLKPEQNPALVYQGTTQRGDADISARKNYTGNPKDFGIELENKNLLPIFLISLLPSLTAFLKQIPKLSNLIKQELNKINHKEKSALTKLAESYKNQEEFANLVAKLLQQKEEENQESLAKNSKNSSDSNQPQDLNNFGAEKLESESKPESAQNQGEEDQETKSQTETQAREVFIEIPSQSQKEQAIAIQSQNNQAEKISFRPSYKVFSSKFDELIYPQKFLARSELFQLRDQLDLKLQKLTGISRKNAIKLRKKLITKKDNQSQASNSCGVLNRKLLSQFISNPGNQNIWQQSQPQQFQDTVLTILLDNSGSMRGNPIAISAMACETIAKTLEEFSIRTEIIGFTTSDWRGGRVRKLWETCGRPKNPGRLNELRHIIYKPFNQSFKKSQINLGMMLKEGILKENIDGEALLFARSRIMQQNAKRKILLVISDGNPVDDSTNSSNQGDILADHLSFVINKIEKQKGSSKIEIIGIGIGHSTSDFYRNEISIKNIEDLGDAMISKIVEIL